MSNIKHLATDAEMFRKWDLITIINALSFDLKLEHQIDHSPSNSSSSKKLVFQFCESISKSLGVFTWISSFLSFEICSSYASSTKELQIETKYIWKWCKWRSYYVHNIIRIIFYLIWFQMFSSHSPFFLHILISLVFCILKNWF